MFAIDACPSYSKQKDLKKVYASGGAGKRSGTRFYSGGTNPAGDWGDQPQSRPTLPEGNNVRYKETTEQTTTRTIEYEKGAE
jgi:hypothetical protein